MWRKETSIAGRGPGGSGAGSLGAGGQGGPSLRAPRRAGGLWRSVRRSGTGDRGPWGGSPEGKVLRVTQLRGEARDRPPPEVRGRRRAGPRTAPPTRAAGGGGGGAEPLVPLLPPRPGSSQRGVLYLRLCHGRLQSSGPTPMRGLCPPSVPGTGCPSPWHSRPAPSRSLLAVYLGVPKGLGSSGWLPGGVLLPPDPWQHLLLDWPSGPLGNRRH